MHNRRRLSIRLAWEYPEAWRAGRLLIRTARAAAEAEGFNDGDLSIAVVDAAAMAELHQRFMQQPGPTDVLTFDLGTDQRRGRLDGQVVVCADVAREAAGGAHARQSSARRELALYIVHAVLHLAGYDDRSPAGFRRMHDREDAILESLGLGRVFSEGDGRR